jgi:transposase
MSKRYRDTPATQTLLLPPSLHDWLPEGHLANFVVDVVSDLDLSAIESVIQGKDPRGERPYSPHMMVALLFYAYTCGTFSSRRIARACVENVAFRVVSANHQPHFTVIAGFRRRYLRQLEALFLQVLQLCQAAGMVKGEHVHVDGTKVQANASKHKAMSYAGMKEREARLKREIEDLLKEAEQADATEDGRLGEGRDEDDGVAPEVKRRESRREWIRQQRLALEEEARRARAEELREQAAEQRRKAEDEADGAEQKRKLTRAKTAEEKADALERDTMSEPPAADPLPRHAPATEPDGAPKPDAQRNFTDPDSRIMLGKKGAYEQCYNGQVVVDESSHVILAQALSNQAPDSEYLPPMLDRTVEALGRPPGSFTGDAGYMSQRNIAAALHRGTTPYLAVERERRSWPPPTPAEGAPPRGADAKAWMAWMLRTREGQTRMRKRKSTVELVFGCIKGAMGFRQFLLRGIEKVRGEWALVCIAYNIRKLHIPNPA